MKKLSERSPDLANLAKVERERDEALSQLKSKTTELEGRKKDVRYLNRTRKVYLDDYTDKYKAWEDEKAELKRSFDKERERMLTDHKDASVQTQQQLDSLKHSYDGLQKEHRHTVDEAQLVKSKLDVATRELAQSQAYTSHLGQLETESL
jgi:collagenase-like PrtC family protease